MATAAQWKGVAAARAIRQSDLALNEHHQGRKLQREGQTDDGNPRQGVLMQLLSLRLPLQAPS